MIRRLRYPLSRKFKIAATAVIATLLIGLLILNFRNPQTELEYQIEFPDSAGALSERARNGVKVHVLIDWLGSQKIDENFIQQMESAGVEIERYHALRWYNLSRMNYRTHRKILVVDGRIGFTGGVGIADEWSGDGTNPEKWRDSHYKAEGPVVRQMQAAFMDNWLKSRADVDNSEDYFPDVPAVGKSQAQMFKSSSGEGGSSVRIMYLLAIAAAKRSIKIESAYFVPDDTHFAARELESFQLDRQRSKQVSLAAWQSRPFFDKVTEQIMIMFRSQF